MFSLLRPTKRLAILAAVAVFAFGVVGCGDSGDDDSGSDGSGSASQSQTTGGSDGGSSGSDEQQARATVDSLYAAIRDSDAEGVCATMTEPAQKQVAQGAIGTGKGGTCKDGFQRFLDAADRAGGLSLTLKAKVESVKVTGDKAVAKVTFGKARSGNIPLVKVDGEWKLDQAGAAPSQ